MFFDEFQKKMALNQPSDTTWSVIGSLDPVMQMKKVTDDLSNLDNPDVTTTEMNDEHADGDHSPSSHQVKHSRSSIVPTYPIIQFEFERVQTPLVIGIWILSASIAKIGKPSFFLDNLIKT